MDQQKDIFRKRVKALCKETAREYELRILHANFLMRIENDIILSIVFDFAPSSLHFHVVAQPLYIKSKMLHLGFGYQIERDNFSAVGHWGKCAEKIDDDIDELRYLIRTKAIPFLRSVSSPEKLIDYIKSGKTQGMHWPVRERYLVCAYSLIKLKRYEEAIPFLSYAIDDLSEYSDITLLEKKANLETLVSDILHGEFDKLDSMIHDAEEYTIRECKLEQFMPAGGQGDGSCV